MSKGEGLQESKLLAKEYSRDGNVCLFILEVGGQKEGTRTKENSVGITKTLNDSGPSVDVFEAFMQVPRTCAGGTSADTTYVRKCKTR